MSRIVVALGGNALGASPESQQENISHAVSALTDLIEEDNEVVFVHGNGPQVGMISLAFEEGAKENARIPMMPLAESTAMSQGYIGYHLQKAVEGEMHRRGIKKNAACLITQVLVNMDDEAFSNPTKPIGPFYTLREANALSKKNPSQVYHSDAGRGYRRMVASPKPVDIIEKDVILSLIKSGVVVVALGGGGVPVVREDGLLKGVDAVVDKDYAASQLASLIGADTLLILTTVERVYINYRTENEKALSSMSVSDAKRYCAELQFAPGSMLPKVCAAVDFVSGDFTRRAVIASLENAADAAKGKSGTLVYQD